MNLGLTGGIASGKSTVARMLVDRGAMLIDADQIAREVVLPGSPVLEQIVSTFGQAVIQPDGTLDRKQLGQIIFNEPEARKKLEQIMHPPIRSILLERVRRWEQEYPDRLIVADIPLLFESGYEDQFSEVMLIYVPENVQIERLMKRNQLSKQEARARVKAQMPIEQKKQLADIIIDNSGSLEHTEQQIDQFWKRKGFS